MKKIIFVFFWLMPSLALANVSITEIMYDVEGSDTGREWIEIYSGNEKDMTDWKFFEEGTNHGLSVFQGNALIPAGGYAIIADSPQKFLLDFSYSGTIFDSSFSLKNTGETIALKDESLNIVDSVAYDPALGGLGDGKSLQLDGSGNWLAGLPSPGAGYQTSGSAETYLPEASQQNAATANSSSTHSSWPVEPQVFADAGKDKTAIVGASVLFEAKAYGLKKEPLENARYVWNFGDGATGEGKQTTHVYRHPGDYIAVLDVSSGYFSGTDQLKVKAMPSPLAISSINDGLTYFVEISNGANTDIDVSSWLIMDGDRKFEIPKNTYIMAGKKLIFSNETTGLNVQAGSLPELRYPNGTLAYRFEMKKSAPPTIPEKANRMAVAEQGSSPKITLASEKNMTSSMAAVGETIPNGSGFNYIWLLGVGAISAIAVIGVLMLKKFEKPEDEIEKLAREFEIIEDKKY